MFVDCFVASDIMTFIHLSELSLLYKSFLTVRNISLPYHPSFADIYLRHDCFPSCIGQHPICRCVDCGRTFMTRHQLLTHMEVHNPFKPYLCQDCGVSFCSAGSLWRHIGLRHSEPRSPKIFTCADCSMSFTYKDHLIYHMYTHTGTKPFVCDVCGKSFTRKENLQQHAVIHSDVKPFKCHLCNRGFSWKSHLTAHLRVHAGVKPHKCEHCDSAFGQRSCLRLHMKSVHKTDLPYRHKHFDPLKSSK